MMYDELAREWQIALRWNGHVLYGQELEGEGYDSEAPFDFYIARDEDMEFIAQETIAGEGYVEDGGSLIDWPGLIGYAREYELGGNVEASPFNWFFQNIEECEIIDADDLSERLMDANIM